jgi:hypothetical protein
MGNLIVNQCEYGCGVVGHWDLDYQKQVGEELEEHYKNCPIKKRFGDRALKEDYRLLIEEDKKINNKMENKIITDKEENNSAELNNSEGSEGIPNNSSMLEEDRKYIEVTATTSQHSQNSQEDLQRIKDIKENLKSSVESFVNKGIITDKDWISGYHNEIKQEAQEIAERNEFLGGCGKEYFNYKLKNIITCGKSDWSYGDVLPICQDCQAKKDIQKEWESIKNDN